MWGMIIPAAISLLGTLYSSNQQGKAASGASNAQVAGAQAGIDEQRRQFDAIQELLKPYITAGTGALGGQQALLGLGGPEAQRAAIAGIEGSPQFGALVQQGENAMLQNASATGGLRGGNTQAALSQFRPAMLSQLIEQQYGRLGQIAGMGQASAAGQAAQMQRYGESTADLYGQMGAAQAGGILGQGQANAMIGQGLGSLGGLLYGLNKPTTSATTTPFYRTTPEAPLF